jgi:hypothetical protein
MMLTYLIINQNLPLEVNTDLHIVNAIIYKDVVIGIGGGFLDFRK